MLKIFHSKYNKEIKVKKFLWETSVWVGGYQQSGPLVRDVWKKALTVIATPPAGVGKQSSKNILILGLGCGTVVQLLLKKIPEVKITGIEIDPVMIEIGKKYFDLSEIKNLKIICSDAKSFLQKTKEKFDVILVDMYFGNVAEKCYTSILKKMLEKNGVIISNNLIGYKNSLFFIHKT